MKKYYFDNLKKHMDEFNYDKSDFILLEQMSFDRLEEESEATIKVTPLLSQITGYALIGAMFDNEEFGLIEFFCPDTVRYSDAQTVIGSSFDLVIDALDNDCKHPLFNIFEAYINGNDTYEEMMENMCYFIDNVDIGPRDNIFYDFDLVDTYMIDERERILKKTVNGLSNIKSTKELLNLLSSIARIRARHNLLMGSYILNRVDNVVYKQALKSDVDTYNVTLSNMFEQINKGKEYYEDDVISAIDVLEEEYSLYKSYQYDYLKNSDEQVRLLEKCKKV